MNAVRRHYLLSCKSCSIARFSAPICSDDSFEIEIHQIGVKANRPRCGYFWGEPHANCYIQKFSLSFFCNMVQTKAIQEKRKEKTVFGWIEPKMNTFSRPEAAIHAQNGFSYFPHSTPLAGWLSCISITVAGVGRPSVSWRWWMRSSPPPACGCRGFDRWSLQRNATALICPSVSECRDGSRQSER